MNKSRILYTLLLIFLLYTSAFGQIHEIRIGTEYNNLKWENFVEKVEQNFPVRFYYIVDPPYDLTLKVEKENQLLIKVLDENLGSLDIKASIDGNNNVFLIKEIEVQTKLSNGFFQLVDVTPTHRETKETSKSKYLRTTRKYVARELVIGTKKEGLFIHKAEISGYIKNAIDGTPVIGGNIFIEELKTGTTTDINGLYSIKLKKGKYNLAISSIEMEEQKYKVNLLSDGELNAKLYPKSYLLDEVVISSERNHNVRSTKMGFEKLTAREVSEVPAILGEKDVIKVALLLPGIQTVGEGSSGFNVRGSPADQNLFYISDVPVYNTSHLLGFFSAFNSDIVNEFDLYKGNIPVNFGGRLASIFDITPKTGNEKKFSARGGISPITGRLMVEGPFKKGKSSYLVGLRSTYSDWILDLVKNKDVSNSSASFGDAVVNLNLQLNDKNQLSLFTYGSFDNINIAGMTKHNYENMGGSLAWKHFFGKKLSFDLSVLMSRYSFAEQNRELEVKAYKQSYDLNHYEAKMNFNYHPNDKHDVSFGINSILYELERGDYLPLNTESLVESVTFGMEKGIENGIYLGDTWRITPLLEISSGLRYNLYAYPGPKTVYKYLEYRPREKVNITDTLHFGNNEIVKTYGGLDYRLAAKYMLHENFSVKAGYNSLHQYIFLLSNTIAISPTDIWKLADYNIKPMTGEQYLVGMYSNLFKNKLEFSVEGYYKIVYNLVEYKDGAEFLVNQVPETDIVQGRLTAYGLEFMLRKPHGKLNGWINYTISNATVEVDNPITGEKNNFGEPYPANWDIPHAFNLMANYKISRRLSISGNVVYSTGRPVTYPTAIYYQNGVEILHYSRRNEYRLPDYFRIDLSITLEGNLLAKKLAHGSYTISVYNLTGRKNAYSVYFRSDTKAVNAYKLSIFGTPIFSVTYNFKLGNYAD